MAFFCRSLTPLGAGVSLACPRICSAKNAFLIQPLILLTQSQALGFAKSICWRKCRFSFC
jgi:hypothetical protein